MVTPKGIEAGNRSRLELLHRKFSAPFNISQAATVLELSPRETQRRMAYLASRGWLSRMGSGFYSVVPLGAGGQSNWQEDPWLVGHRLFKPCYLGGWTACEHWGLTEQIFQKLVLVTGKKIRQRERRVQDTTYLLKYLPVGLHFGTKQIWRGQEQVTVSDPTRTLLDIMDEPRLGGGIRHVTDVLINYFTQEHEDQSALIEYASRLNNRTIYKRLGYLLEALAIPRPDLIKVCFANRSAGITTLDPDISSVGRISTKWNLRINVNIQPPSPA